MQVRPVNYSDYRINKTTQKSSPMASSVGFSGIRQVLTTVTPENFKSDTAKKLFSQIHKYCQILKTGGSLNEVKILSEDLDFLNYKTMQDFTTKVDTLLSIKSDSEKALIKLYRRYQDKTKHCLMEAQLDKKVKWLKVCTITGVCDLNAIRIISEGFIAMTQNFCLMAIMTKNGACRRTFCR